MIYNEMKLDTISYAQEAKTLRRYERKFTKSAAKQRYRQEFPTWDVIRSEYYTERMGVRVAARYLHLARAYLKGMEYKMVEQSTREGNEPDVDSLVATLHSYGYVTPGWAINKWVNG